MYKTIQVLIGGSAKSIDSRSLKINYNSDNRSKLTARVDYGYLRDFNAKTDGPRQFTRVMAKLIKTDNSESLIFDGYITKAQSREITGAGKIVFTITAESLENRLKQIAFRKSTPYRSLPVDGGRLYLDTVIKRIYKDFLEPEGFYATFNTECDGEQEEQVDAVYDPVNATIKIDPEDIGVKVNNDSGQLINQGVGEVKEMRFPQDLSLDDVFSYVFKDMGYVWRIETDLTAPIGKRVRLNVFKPFKGGNLVHAFDNNSTGIYDFSFMNSTDNYVNETIFYGGQTGLPTTEILSTIDIDFKILTTNNILIATGAKLLNKDSEDITDNLTNKPTLLVPGDVENSYVVLRGTKTANYFFEYQPGTKELVQVQNPQILDATGQKITDINEIPYYNILCKFENDDPANELEALPISVLLNTSSDGIADPNEENWEIDQDSPYILELTYLAGIDIKMNRENPYEQSKVARRLGFGQGKVSKVQRREDLRLYSLANVEASRYLEKYSDFEDRLNLNIRSDKYEDLITWRPGDLIDMELFSLAPENIYNITNINYSIYRNSSSELVMEGSFEFTDKENNDTWRSWWQDRIINETVEINESAGIRADNEIMYTGETTTIIRDIQPRTGGYNVMTGAVQTGINNL